MKKLKVIFQLESGKKVTKEFPLKSPVSNPTINKVFEKQVYPYQHNHNATLYHYDPVETDVKITAFCKKEKKEVKVNTVYGGFDTPLKCKCGSKVYDDFMYDKCPECGKAKLWLTNTRSGGEELMIMTYKCPECGFTEEEPFD